MPTASLATSAGRGPATAASATRPWCWAGSIRSDDDTVARNAFKQLAAVLPGAVALRSPLPAPSALYATLLNRLIVLDDLAASARPAPMAGRPCRWNAARPAAR